MPAGEVPPLRRRSGAPGGAAASGGFGRLDQIVELVAQRLRLVARERIDPGREPSLELRRLLCRIAAARDGKARPALAVLVGEVDIDREAGEAHELRLGGTRRRKGEILRGT